MIATDDTASNREPPILPDIFQMEVAIRYVPANIGLGKMLATCAVALFKENANSKIP